MAESNKAYNNLIARGFSNEQIRSMFGNIGIPEVDLSGIEDKLDNLSNSIKAFEQRLNKLERKNTGGRF